MICAKEKKMSLNDSREYRTITTDLSFDQNPRISSQIPKLGYLDASFEPINPLDVREGVGIRLEVPEGEQSA
jgi:hypothetical protein